jgi:hypothetical protein
MRFKAQPIEIPNGDPFANDALTRRKSAEVLTDFMGSLSQPFVLAVDAPFGMGKTTFINMWMQHLRNEHFSCLYFNAWETDFTESPLVSLIGEISAEIKALKLEKKNKTIAKFLKQTQKVGATLVKADIPIAVKMATSGLLDLSHIKEGDLAKAAEELAKKQIEKYQEDKKTIHRFKEDLAALVSALAEHEGAQSPKPVIFVIDELDRCRPPYAIELLEKIKHLFSVQGLVFVLAIDRHQLQESTKALYGTGVDTDGYLRRFIDLEFCLPEPSAEGFVAAQFSRFGLDEIFAAKVGETQHERGFIEQTLSRLFTLFRFSLRTMEQCFTQLAFVLRTTPPEFFLYGNFLSLLLCLRTANRPLYYQYCRGDITSREVLDWLRSLPGGGQFIDSSFGMAIEANLVLGIRDADKRRPLLANYKTLAESDTADRHVSQRADQILHAVSRRSFNMPDDLTGYLYPKIEFMQRFVKPKESPEQPTQGT